MTAPVLTRVPAPTTHRPDRLALICEGQVVTHVRDHWYAEHFERGWNAAFAGSSRHRSPYGARHRLTPLWRRGYDAAQAKAREQRAAAPNARAVAL